MLARVAACEKAIAALKSDMNDGFSHYDILPGQTITFSKGCELLFVEGELVLQKGQVCDTTAGSINNESESLELTHIYVCLQDCVINSQSSDTITIFVRGDMNNE